MYKIPSKEPRHSLCHVRLEQRRETAAPQLTVAAKLKKSQLFTFSFRTRWAGIYLHSGVFGRPFAKKISACWNETAAIKKACIGKYSSITIYGMVWICCLLFIPSLLLIFFFFYYLVACERVQQQVHHTPLVFLCRICATLPLLGPLPRLCQTI